MNDTNLPPPDDAPPVSAALELEHLIGLTNRFPNTVRFNPAKNSEYLYPVGAAVVIEDINNPHSQNFLRAHDAEISALCLTKNGKLCATGQRGSEQRKGKPAPVIVWDLEGGKNTILRDFSGLSESVLGLEFSPDGRFLVAFGANQMMFIWDVTTGETVYSRKTESVCSVATWGPVLPPHSANRYPSYLLCTAFESEVLLHDLVFDIRTMCYALESAKVQLPAAGLHRRHLCGLVCGDSFITGTEAGDICVFGMTNRVFRCAVPVLNGGVRGIMQYDALEDGRSTLIMCGGDGKVKTIRGQEMHWDVLRENILESPCQSISCSRDGRELLVGTKNGKLWRLLTSDLTATLHASAHTAPLSKGTFGAGNSELLCTTSDGGELFLWDLSDYSLLMSAHLGTKNKKVPVVCVCVSETEDEILCGCEDGFLRAFRLSRRVANAANVWDLADCHRGAVTAVAEWPQYIVTGGEDKYVRVWHRKTRELLSHFCVHRKVVTDVILDNDPRTPHYFHSASEDKFVITYDMKQNRSVVQHCSPNSNVTGLSQRKDCEREVLSCGLDGRILFWDIDVTEPVGCFHEQGCKFLCLQVSPSGQYVAAGSEEGFLYVFDLALARKVQQLEGHTSAVCSVAWAPDGKQIITSARDCSIGVWNFFDLNDVAAQGAAAAGGDGDGTPRDY